ncbi:MAG: uracil-xanthine permease family protein [Janthinobacterium lividum]
MIDDHAADRIPLARLLLLGLQHLLVMAAAPLTSGLIVGAALHLDPSAIGGLIATLFLVCGLGTLLQSIGIGGLGARLPFVMIPGGAPMIAFIDIAAHSGPATATGAVLLAGLLNLLVVPLFARALRFFPPLVIGTMLLLVCINLVRIAGTLILAPDRSGHADPAALGLAIVTVVLTLLLMRILPGRARQLAVFAGLLCGTLVALMIGRGKMPALGHLPLLGLPHLFPFGSPHFDLAASTPLLLLGLISMVEATSQTVALSETVGRPPRPRLDVPRTVRGDAVISLLGACFGTSLIITSGDNIGIVRATGVRSRRVTATAGSMLVVLALVTPLNRLAGALPGPVVAGAVVIISCIIGAIGIEMLRRADLGRHDTLIALAGSLAFGLLPILCPQPYQALPPPLRLLLGNGLAAGTLAGVLLNLLFCPAATTRRDFFAKD